MSSYPVAIASLAAAFFQDQYGNALSGRQIYVYERDTTTEVPVYADETLTLTLTQPLATSFGSLPGYLASGQAIDFYDAADGIRAQAEAISAQDETSATGNPLGTLGITIDAPGATPWLDIGSFNWFHFTGCATAITSMTSGLTGVPVGGQPIVITFTDNGTAQAITWGSGYVSNYLAAVPQMLPTTTVVGERVGASLLYSVQLGVWVCYSAGTGY